MLTRSLTLRQTLRLARRVERVPVSRFRFGSPCRYVRAIDIIIHLVLPEILEDTFPRLTTSLRSTSPRWGRSWRSW